MNHPRDCGPHFPGCGDQATPGGPRGPFHLHPRRFRRRARTRQERIARLETYLSELRQEAQAVEERLAQLRASS